jgi:hypothetical protein
MKSVQDEDVQIKKTSVSIHRPLYQHGNVAARVANREQPRSTEVEVNLQPTVSRPVCLGVWRPSGTLDQFLFLFEISFRPLRFVILQRPL